MCLSLSELQTQAMSVWAVELRILPKMSFGSNWVPSEDLFAFVFVLGNKIKIKHIAEKLPNNFQFHKNGNKARETVVNISANM